jgi:hypothetical protein
MVRDAGPSRVLIYQSAGFLAIIALAWLDEMTGFHQLLLGDQQYISDFRRSIVEMVMVLGVWFLVAGSTRRLMARVKHLGGFMKVCAWCRRIEQNGEWMPIEEFLQRGFDTPTSHGICDCCLNKAKEEAEHARQLRERASGHGEETAGVR